jgi:hypothetical protein
LPSLIRQEPIGPSVRESIKLIQRLTTVAMEPTMAIRRNNEPSLSVAFGLDTRPRKRENARRGCDAVPAHDVLPVSALKVPGLP